MCSVPLYFFHRAHSWKEKGRRKAPAAESVILSLVRQFLAVDLHGKDRPAVYSTPMARRLNRHYNVDTSLPFPLLVISNRQVCVKKKNVK